MPTGLSTVHPYSEKRCSLLFSPQAIWKETNRLGAQSLAEAREVANEFKSLTRKGINPNQKTNEKSYPYWSFMGATRVKLLP